jgi:transposase
MKTTEIKTEKTETKIDARKLTPRELSEKRRIVIKLRQKGLSNKEVAEIVGISKQTTSTYYTRYKKEGEKIFTVKSAGCPKGTNKALTKEQETNIQKKLIDTTPEQLKFKFALWTREAVQALIKHELNIDMPISTVGDYLKKWQFTSKKPIKRAYERKDVATKEWLEKAYPAIKKEAKKESADIWWCDETSCQSLPNNLKGYAPIGTHNKPVLHHTSKRFKLNMISAITHTGKCMFSISDESIKIDSFIDFLSKVIRSQRVERGFRFLKSPEFLSDALFLKKPERIEAMLMIMTLCLWSMRAWSTR